MKHMSEYTEQAEKFLKDNGIKFRATLSDSKVAPWDAAGEQTDRHHYRITLSKGRPCTPDYTGNVKSAYRLTFDFWGSVVDAEQGRHPEAYDVLACISGDVNCPETFEDYCAEFGESTDSIKAKQTFNRVARFAKRLRQFFTAQEIEQLQEIQ